jgi:serine protease Do
MMTSPATRYGAVALLFAVVIAFQLSSGNTPFEFASLENPPADRRINSIRDISDAMVDIAGKANPAVVTVFTERTVRVQQRDPFADFFGPGFFGAPTQPRERQYQQSGQGSGVILSKDGYIVTNNHVIQNADSIRIRTNENKVIAAKLIGADPNTDIAILKVDGEFPAMPLGDSDKLRVGEWILAIGSPMSENLANTVTMGIVSAKGRSNVGLVEMEDFIQTDAAINPGNSGGALLNLDGELVGINTAIASQTGGFQGIGFAIPINMVRNIMTSIIETGKVVRPWVGIYPQDIDATMSRALNLATTDGILVAQVVDEGPAKNAGVQEGDVILEVDGRKVTNASQFRAYVASQVPGKSIKLKINREGRNRDITVKLEELPAEGTLAAGQDALWDRIGFTFETADADKGVRGVQVSAINAQSQAYQAGLRKDDLIIGINRRAVRTAEEASALLEPVKRGEVVLVQLVRGRQSFFFAFEMG